MTHHYLVVKSNLSLSHMFASIWLVEIVCCYCKLPCNTHKNMVTCWTQFLLKLIISYEGMELKAFCLYFYTYHNKIRYVCMTISRTPSALVLHMHTKSIGEKLTAWNEEFIKIKDKVQKIRGFNIVIFYLLIVTTNMSTKLYRLIHNIDQLRAYMSIPMDYFKINQ